MAGVRPEATGVFGRNAQGAVIAKRPGERVKSSRLLPFKVGPLNGREAQESGLWLNA
jgi:hypothetical protein